jgi:hypothetical protein
MQDCLKYNNRVDNIDVAKLKVRKSYAGMNVLKTFDEALEINPMQRDQHCPVQ